MHEVLAAFVFHQDCIKWIMALVSGAFFSILVNGSPSKPFSPSRGIRQGDPLSPFLFFIMAEGLSRTLQVVNINNSLICLKLCNPAPASTHHQFFDDTLLMGIPTVDEVVAFKCILNCLFEASGTSINLEKSKIFFLNTPLAIQRNVTRILGF